MPSLLQVRVQVWLVDLVIAFDVFVEPSWNTKESSTFVERKQVTQKDCTLQSLLNAIYCNLLPGSCWWSKNQALPWWCRTWASTMSPHIKKMPRILGQSNLGSGHQVCSVETFDSGIAIRFGQLLGFQWCVAGCHGHYHETFRPGHAGYDSVNIYICMCIYIYVCVVPYLYIHTYPVYGYVQYVYM